MLRIDPNRLQDTPMANILSHLIKKHDATRPAKLQDYYEGRHDILDRQMADSTKPNNRIVNPIAAYITDTMTGYFIGKPVSYTAPEAEQDFLDELNSILEANDEQDHNSELAKGMSIKGAAYELLYTDENADIKFADLPREDVIYVETDDVEAKPALAIRAYKVDVIGGDTKQFYDVYTDEEIITFEARVEGQSKALIEVNRIDHYFGDVPVVMYPNNRERMGDFETVLTLIDAYDIAQSDTANDFEYFTDAYLKLTGATLDDETAARMKENRVISLPDEQSDAAWLIKDINDTAVENYKDRLRSDIHAFSKVPDLSDDTFGTQISGVAIAFRMWGMEQITGIKERKFKRGLQRRIQLICNFLAIQERDWDWRDIDITFSRNIPPHITEQVDMVQKLRGIVSDKTLLSQLPFIEDPTKEIERIDEQEEGQVDLDQVAPFEEVEEDGA